MTELTGLATERLTFEAIVVGVDPSDTARIVVQKAAELAQLLSAPVHLVCAAYESPLSESDLELFGGNAARLAADLEAESKLIRRNGRWFFRGDQYPAGEVNIRSASV